MRMQWIAGALIAMGATAAHAGVMQFGDRTLMGTGSYPSDPTAGATTQGLAAGQVSLATNTFPHAIPTQAPTGAYPGTGRVYTSGTPAGVHDSYSALPFAAQGPQVISMDYGSLVPSGQSVSTLTLGLAADDFQNPSTKEPYTATVNGVVDAALSNQLNAMQLGGPVERFFAVGVDPSLLSPSNVLTVGITRAGGGSGSDGWGVDFATVGVTAVPEPTTLAILGLGLVGLRHRARRSRVAAV